VTRLTRPGWIVVGALLVLTVMAVFGDNGVLALRRLRGEVDTLVREVRTLEAENERLSRAITELPARGAGPPLPPKRPARRGDARGPDVAAVTLAGRPAPLSGDSCA
jgi:hypothetical protein